MLQSIQLLHVHRFERTVDVVDEDLHHQKAHQHVEKDAEFYDQRNAVCPQHGKQGNAVLKDQKADDLSQRLASRDYDKQVRRRSAPSPAAARRAWVAGSQPQAGG